MIPAVIRIAAIARRSHMEPLIFCIQFSKSIMKQKHSKAMEINPRLA